MKITKSLSQSEKVSGLTPRSDLLSVRGSTLVTLNTEPDVVVSRLPPLRTSEVPVTVGVT